MSMRPVSELRPAVPDRTGAAARGAAVQREGPRLSRVARLARLVQSCAITGARAVVIGADWTS